MIRIRTLRSAFAGFSDTDRAGGTSYYAQGFTAVGPRYRRRSIPSSNKTAASTVTGMGNITYFANGEWRSLCYRTMAGNLSCKETTPGAFDFSIVRGVFGGKAKAFSATSTATFSIPTDQRTTEARPLRRHSLDGQPASRLSQDRTQWTFMRISGSSATQSGLAVPVLGWQLQFGGVLSPVRNDRDLLAVRADGNPHGREFGISRRQLSSGTAILPARRLTWKWVSGQITNGPGTALTWIVKTTRACLPHERIHR